MAKFDIILFDADDTLLDFAKDEEQALTQTLIEYGIDCNDSIKERYKSINEALWKAFENGEVTKEDIQNIRFTKLFQELAIDKDGYKCNTDYLEALGYGSFLIPGAKEICGELRKMCRLYIVTNGISRTQYRRFNNSGINKFFTDIFVSEDSGYQKPQIEFFDYVFDKIGKLDKSRVLIVGDSLSSDIKGGNNAGIATCWFNPKGLKNETDIKCSYEIQDLSQLLDIVK